MKGTTLESKDHKAPCASERGARGGRQRDSKPGAPAERAEGYTTV